MNGKEGNDLCQAVQDLMNKGAVDARVEAILHLIDSLHISIDLALQYLGIPEDQWSMYRELVEQAQAEQADT